VSEYRLYLIVTADGQLRVVPVRCADESGEQHEYNRTKEIGLERGRSEWIRMFTDRPNGCYRVYSAPAGRYAEPLWPDLKPSKIFRLGFRDKGRLLDSPQHPLFLKWTARDRD